MLNQAETASIIIKTCIGNKLAIEEVLSAYALWKYHRGANSLQVLYKLRGLIFRLRIIGYGHIIQEAEDTFRIILVEVALGGGRIGLSTVMTPQGKLVFNRIRAALSRQGRAIPTDLIYGGPMPVAAFLKPEQMRPVMDGTRERWAEQYFSMRPQIFGTPGPIPEYVSASQRITALPLYGLDEEISRELRLAVQDIEQTTSFVSPNRDQNPSQTASLPSYDSGLSA